MRRDRRLAAFPVLLALAGLALANPPVPDKAIAVIVSQDHQRP